MVSAVYKGAIMIKLVLPFIPPTSNHTQGMAYSPKLKRTIQFNKPEYNKFKEDVKACVQAQLGDRLDELKALLSEPHRVHIWIYSKRVCTKSSKYKKINEKFGDEDNFKKPTYDAIHPIVDANDAYVVHGVCRKIWWDNDEDLTIIEFFPDSPFRDARLEAM